MISKSQAGSLVILVLMVAAVAGVQVLTHFGVFVPPIIGWVAGLMASSLTASFRSILPALSGKAAGDVSPVAGQVLAQLGPVLQQIAQTGQQLADPNRTRALTAEQVWRPAQPPVNQATPPAQGEVG